MGKSLTKKEYPHCSVCKKMKADKAFREACLASTYFDPSGVENLNQVNNRFGQPFKMQTLYRHMAQHMKEQVELAEKLAEMRGMKSKTWQRHTARAKSFPQVVEPKPIDTEALNNTIAVVEGKAGKPEFEVALDEFITVGRTKMDMGQIPISAANYIAAIKVKADLEMRTKDRKLELLKGMFNGAAPKTDA